MPLRRFRSHIMVNMLKTACHKEIEKKIRDKMKRLRGENSGLPPGARSEKILLGQDDAYLNWTEDL
jgi:hypothetical protein